jgi:protein SMG6
LTIVITELDGLKVNSSPLGSAASEALTFIESNLHERKLRVVTQQGTGLTNLAFRSQQLMPKSTEDGASNIDAFIIESVKDQIERHTGTVTKVEKAVLVTGDRSMRLIAKARGVHAMTATEMRKEIFKQYEQPRRKSEWG